MKKKYNEPFFELLRFELSADLLTESATGTGETPVGGIITGDDPNNIEDDNYFIQ